MMVVCFLASGKMVHACDDGSQECKISYCNHMSYLLKEHNKYRKMHNSQPLLWNASVAYSAAAWVNKCNISHDKKLKGVWGENILYGKVPVSKALYDAPRMWYNEVKTYNYSKPVANHFTQMVWNATSSLGCAFKVCNRTSFVVCRYYKPGNVAGQFQKNVLRRV